MHCSAPYLVVGLGNEFRSDDGCGPATARDIGRLCGDLVQVIEPMADSSGLVMLWSGVEVAILIDSVRSGSLPGKTFRFEPFKEPIPESVFRPTTTHRLSVTQIIHLAEALGQLPKRLIIYGIEGANFDHGTAMTPTVATAAHEVAVRVAAEILQAANVAAPR